MTAEGLQAMQPRLRKMMDEATAKADKFNERTGRETELCACAPKISETE